MRPVISDFGARPTAASVNVESMVRDRLHRERHARLARVRRGDARAAWGTLTATGGATGVVFATRSGNTATPDALVVRLGQYGRGGAIASPAGRYIQYARR